jgi:hypothetical protein
MAGKIYLGTADFPANSKAASRNATVAIKGMTVALAQARRSRPTAAPQSMHTAGFHL